MLSDLISDDLTKCSMARRYGGWLAVGLVLAPVLSATDDWLPMPNGLLFHRSCIHRWDRPIRLRPLPDGSQRATGPNGLDQSIPPCPHKPRAASSRLGYYSDW